jgi:hypothetical protein
MFETKKVFTYLIFGAFLVSAFSYAQSEDLAEKSRRGKEDFWRPAS